MSLYIQVKSTLLRDTTAESYQGIEPVICVRL
uniref:Uncharacterized protein n=1 Tax=Anguilla anguilla TaxID=7936 RepID=A0A0E9XZV3_ANGAN